MALGVGGGDGGGGAGGDDDPQKIAKMLEAAAKRGRVEDGGGAEPSWKRETRETAALLKAMSTGPGDNNEVLMTAIANAIYKMEGRQGLPMPMPAQAAPPAAAPGRPRPSRARTEVLWLPAHRLPLDVRAMLGSQARPEELYPLRVMPAPVQVPVMRPPPGRFQPLRHLDRAAAFEAGRQAVMQELRADAEPAANWTHAENSAEWDAWDAEDAEAAAANANANANANAAVDMAVDQPLQPGRVVNPLLPLLLPDPEVLPLPADTVEALEVAYEVAATASAAEQQQKQLT